MKTTDCDWKSIFLAFHCTVFVHFSLFRHRSQPLKKVRRVQEEKLTLSAWSQQLMHYRASSFQLLCFLARSCIPQL
ncbi:hypothetical protein XENTR_v10014624 [Xenopus tropicalis]|nr:hypothetical protein XENTR_v10014624 [Xenopus tropicalis]